MDDRSSFHSTAASSRQADRHGAQKHSLDHALGSNRMERVPERFEAAAGRHCRSTTIAATSNPAIPSLESGSVSAGRISAQRDPYCGPRCVHEVLLYYGIQRELLDCARELRWNSERSGVDLQSIASFLEDHGTHTLAFGAKPGYIVEWEHPVIAHVPSSDSHVGHFVVLLPNATRDSVHIFDGTNSERVMSAQAFSEMVEGGFLLTSPHPISASIRPFRLTTEELAWRSGVVAFAVLVCGAYVAFNRRHRNPVIPVRT